MATLPHNDIFQLVREPIDTVALAGVVRAPEDGAVVTFDGFVRNQSHNRPTLYLDYEAYESMALTKMREIGLQIHEKYRIHGDAMDAVFFVNLKADFTHFGKSHGFVGFVIEVQGGAVVRLITDETIKSDNGAVFRGPDDAGQRNRVDGFSHQLKDVIVGQCRHGDASAAAHRRKKRNLVAGTEGSVPGGEFLVARSDYRRTVL